MDLKYIENIIKIDEERSITKAAEKLFLTQSALNQQLQKLEAELDTALFVRNRSDWRPTEAGAIYLETARAMVQMKKNAYSRIQDIAQIQHRQITVGLIPERGVDMFTSIYPDFHKQFPDTLLEPVETSVRSMQKQITSGQIDLGLITLNESQKDDNQYLHMADEEILLAVPAKHPLSGAGSHCQADAPKTKLSLFQDAPFVRMAASSTLYAIEAELFLQAGFTPKVLFSTASNLSKFRMVAAGTGCALLPSFFAQGSEDVAYFRLDTLPTWEVTMCCRKNEYLSQAELGFLEACKGYWR